MVKIGIINIGIGNTKGAYNAIKYIGHDVNLVDKKEIKDYSHIIFPGVGNFQAGTKALTPEWREEIKNFIKKGDFFMGICLGMQLLFNKSEESEGEGLGIIKGEIKSIQSICKTKITLPRLGWKLVNYDQEYQGKLGAPGQKSKYYFVHSYALLPDFHEKQNDEFIVEQVEDGYRVAASIEKNNIIGVQYHPEKSSMFGLEILNNFVNLKS
tara:strand:- start:189 stop:821 length:633 start_codon:yes stop_codon:yes gene_type:complete